ncbi:unnamed protein product [Bemisia tabaci]|uniref:Ig-like domain-containing protein n=1 Tax=Bemisia tabaci TaxID=7038 RepID=A0A9N9ZZ92_BEMTA|nr:unnamed protein product [Bemisia tabaci]
MVVRAVNGEWRAARARRRDARDGEEGSPVQNFDHSQAPRISEHPASKTVTKGEPVTLNCKAVGKPEPSIEWYKDGQLVSSSGPQRMVLDRGTSLFFLSTRYGKKDSDSGVYWCVAKNELGQVTSNNATLEVAARGLFTPQISENVTGVLSENANLAPDSRMSRVI